MAALTLRRSITAALATLLLVSCADPLAPPEPMPGTYVLTSYASGPNPDSRMDMIALGVRWILEIGENNSVVSTTWVTGDTIAQPTRRIGAVRRRGRDVTFSRFDGGHGILTLRQWTLDGNELSAIDQTALNVTSTIRFTRQ